MTITIPRSSLVLAGLYCFIAGLCVGNAFAARNAGYSALGSAVAALIAAGLAIHRVRAATRPRSTSPVPRVGGSPAA